MSQPTPAAPSAYSRTNPFPARLSENRLLSKGASTKDTRHIIVDISGSGLVYHAGDSLGVFAQNPPAVVDEIIRLLSLNPEAIIPSPTGEVSLRHALSTGYILNRVGKKFVKAIAEKLPAGEKKDSLAAIVANEEALTEFVFTRDYIDVLLEYPGVHLTSEEFILLVNKTAPRLYSIASSSLPHPEHVHLTVAIVRYETHGRAKKGLASGYMADDCPLGAPVVPVFVQPTRHFHLPPDDVAVIMVGPGTGIAPFRAFLQERKHKGAKGKNWLFFGDQTKAGDFLYEEEFDAYQKEGLLTRLDTAFSRDQAEKIYVQNRMLENGAEMWKWLQEGAYFYVCGDAKRMAKDVHQALITIAQQHGGLTPEKAVEYIEVTFAKTEKRYLKDVY
ncbi:sulfite reductase (NADPH) flavoprotein alpha-component [Verrucomicrobium sp. GAS474]|uniref:diflavin oxidoreductase n=1 Tax=Verrucomicrobium sp. GAS474 TaxID=1882831 RepID=UPI00087C2AAD|nr:sulfite reductase subunit alpha [Verrucomicrobium sp. GAS474]SDU08130.1 sulfite reductase (NADPH) flavoprotein alpha-component [Verrucomicrobium sp. GAS474]